MVKELIKPEADTGNKLRVDKLSLHLIRKFGIIELKKAYAKYMTKNGKK